MQAGSKPSSQRFCRALVGRNSPDHHTREKIAKNGSGTVDEEVARFAQEAGAASSGQGQLASMKCDVTVHSDDDKLTHELRFPVPRVGKASLAPLRRLSSPSSSSHHTAAFEDQGAWERKARIFEAQQAEAYNSVKLTKVSSLELKSRDLSAVVGVQGYRRNFHDKKFWGLFDTAI
eukprot:CAMPEP_0198334766 /NCGR_PEP_ID=MMETSP1450-20131203/19841_1 /TAXON_ID=753684 ORGANISM="Madagascaria erythrocladiodes, Strain CCMP3234" /NCGR_SAMPLE_ID=MMETSP1450 /ASSEMBLY_ACC=CAM_ASM_001115 /LENGTH=175 /DNA_ID=CAMNT_0044039379 /DNA_START=528 /DNA_END=1056 /DNA_ORIENTATION=+